jgi:hypothetical protein
MIIRRIASSMAALVLVGGTLVVVAGSASADEVWYQSVGRASAEAPCPVSTGTELAAGWTQWSPSWAQWGNQGKGGFVCDRQITWAYSPTAQAFPGCQFANDQSYDADPYESTYLQFGSRVLIPAAELNGFDNPDCSGVPFGDSSQDVVFALSQEQAQALCPLGTVAELGIVETIGSLSIINPSPYIYYCVGDR